MRALISSMSALRTASSAPTAWISISVPGSGTPITPEAVVFATDPNLPADLAPPGVDNFGSGAVFDFDFAGDAQVSDRFPVDIVGRCSDFRHESIDTSCRQGEQALYFRREQLEVDFRIVQRAVEIKLPVQHPAQVVTPHQALADRIDPGIADLAGKGVIGEAQ